MNGLFYFCVYMTFIYMPFVISKAVAEDHEIWFGFFDWLVGKSHRTAGDPQRGLRLLAYACVDVALGCGVYRPGCHCDGCLELGQR